MLTPKETWDNKEAYEDYLKDLVQKFQDNIKKFDIREEIIKAGRFLMPEDSLTKTQPTQKQRFFEDLVVLRGIEKESLRVDGSGVLAPKITLSHWVLNTPILKLLLILPNPK